VTVGAPTVKQILPDEGESERTLLAVAASCGFGSLHPVSRAVVAEALARGIVSAPPRDLQERRGLGVVAVVEGQRAVLGRRALLVNLGVTIGSEDDGDVSQVWVAHGGRLLGRRVLRDQPRGEAREALAATRALGIDRLVLLTGDQTAVAREVGEALDSSDCIS
jgi:cation transport ATPase